MKQFLTLLTALVTAATVTAAPIIEAKTNNGNWNSSSTWDLNRKPQIGDIVIVPANILVLLDSSQSLSDLVVRITGTVRLSGEKVNLDNVSRVVVYTNDKMIVGGGKEQKTRGSSEVMRGTGT